MLPLHNLNAKGIEGRVRLSSGITGKSDAPLLLHYDLADQARHSEWRAGRNVGRLGR